MEQKQTKEKLSIFEWFTALERGLLELQQRFPNNLDPATNSANNNVRNDNNIAGPVASPKPLIFADIYFQEALRNYLEIISLVKPIVEKPTEHLEEIKSMFTNPENPIMKGTGKKTFQVGTFGLPHIFHPVLNEDTRRIEFRGDQRCYELALIIRKAFETLNKVDLRWLEVAGHIIKPISQFLKGFKAGNAFILAEIKSRIAKFEYNGLFRDKLNYFYGYVNPLLKRSAESLREEGWTAEDLCILLEELTRIADIILRQPAVIPQYIRDNPQRYFSSGDGLPGSKHYLKRLRNFFSTTPFSDQVDNLYHSSDSATDIDIRENIAVKFSEIIFLMKEAAQHEDYEEESHLDVLTQSGKQHLLDLLQEKVVMLHPRPETIIETKDMLEQTRDYSAHISTHLNTLLTALQVHKDFHSQEWASFFAKNKDMKTFCRRLFEDLQQYAMTATLHTEIGGYANLCIYRDLLNATVALVESAEANFQINSLQATSEYQALITYLSAVEGFVALYNLDAPCDTPNQEMPVVESFKLNSNN
jgi:hypothetical protein